MLYTTLWLTFAGTREVDRQQRGHRHRGEQLVGWLFDRRPSLTIVQMFISIIFREFRG